MMMTTMGVLVMVTVTGVLVVPVMKTVVPVMICVIGSVVPMIPVVRRVLMGWVTVVSHTVVPVVEVTTMEGYPRGWSVVETSVVVTVHV